MALVNVFVIGFVPEIRGFAGKSLQTFVCVCDYSVSKFCDTSTYYVVHVLSTPL